ncbi:MAG TPA: 16S rRNA (adenine(1518)-N(6)/adenine(1519)-N(6))-dimethyltransferase RsmA [Chloroflexota bacterium]|nr:16S rRNA (adenine(1518)-N(6)/adenine(1519)-N(6))-dimethyltransferase RsmA [Chloroflexota bacterium]
MRSVPLPGPGDEPASRRESTIHRGQPPDSPPAIRTLLRELGLRPHKGFGQNFLLDEDVLQKIVEAGDVGPNDVVLEIGPGLGHLTRHLAARAARVVAVEIDRGLVQALRRTFQGAPSVEIVEQDVLQVEPEDLVGDHPYKVIANLPYYITSLALRHFLGARRRPVLMVILVQREVAQRILAPPGDLNLLAISVTVYGQPRQIVGVPPDAFYPRPKVESVVLRIDVFDRPRIDVPAEKFFKVVSAGFAMPRKQLHNALAQRLWMPPGAAPEILRAVGIDPMRRAQTLSIPEWDRLTQEMAAKGIV